MTRRLFVWPGVEDNMVSSSSAAWTFLERLKSLALLAERPLAMKTIISSSALEPEPSARHSRQASPWPVGSFREQWLESVSLAQGPRCQQG